MEKAISNLGFGKFGIVLTAILSLVWFLDGMEIVLASLVANAVRCEWNLSHFQTAAVSSAAFIGMTIASPFTGLLCDKIGRKPVLLVCLLLTGYYGTLCAFSQNHIWFFILRFFVGIGLTSVIIPTCYCTEYFDFKYRGIVLNIFESFFSCGVIIASYLAYLLVGEGRWRLFMLVMSFAAFFVLSIGCWLPESLKYLQITNNYDAIMKTFHRISNINKKPLPKYIANIDATSSRGKHNTMTIIYKEYFFYACITVLLLFFQSLSYNGSTFLSVQLFTYNPSCVSNTAISIGDTTSKKCLKKAEQYLFTTYTSFGDLLGSVSAIFFVGYFDRRYICFILGILNIIAYSLITICLPTNLEIALIFLVRACSVVQLTSAWNVIGETFDTRVRATMFGVSNIGFRSAIILTPFLIQWIFYKSFISICILYVISNLIAMVCVMMLPKYTEETSIK